MAEIDTKKLIAALERASAAVNPLNMQQQYRAGTNPQSMMRPPVSQSEIDSGSIVSRVLVALAAALREATKDG